MCNTETSKAKAETQVQKTPKTKTTLRRSRKIDCDIRSGSKSEALDEELTDRSSTINNGTRRKSEKRVKENEKNKVKIQTDHDSSDPETYSCEYCLTGSHESVIECEKCSK